jgi:hypothetical protein
MAAPLSAEQWSKNTNAYFEGNLNMTLKMKQIAVATLLAFTTAMIAPAATVSAQQAPPTATPITIPIVGTGTQGSFAGTFTLSRFVAQNGVLSAVGVLAGTVTNTATGAVTSIARNVTLPVLIDPAQATCEILHLELGPLDLNLLGLLIHLDQVVLDISAQPGPGNLLGNLLCGVANLLNNPNGLAALLNRILGAL